MANTTSRDNTYNLVCGSTLYCPADASSSTSNTASADAATTAASKYCAYQTPVVQLQQWQEQQQ
jgi:hypothetical protein